jgi:uncharacterized protein (TIGR03437 family)
MTKLRYFVLFPLFAGLANAEVPKAPLAELPLQFEVNRGQAASPVRFLSRGHGYGLALAPSEATFVTAGSAVKMKIAGGNPAAHGRGEELLPGRSNYFKGADPNHWRTGIETYRKVRFEKIYPGIDLVYYGNHGELEYDFVLRPGADPSAIALEFDGLRSVRVGSGGDLILGSESGEIRHKKPVIYQETGGKRAEVSGGYRMLGRNRVGFQLGAYDRSRELVIDPTLLFATFYGGQIRETATSIAVDNQGNVYVAGLTSSSDFPTTPGAFQRNKLGSGADIFVVKINATGTAVLYSTMIGGTDEELAPSLAVDSAGNAYLAGTTQSLNFPVTPGALRIQPAGANDGFIVKLNASGSDLLYATRLGGSAADSIHAIAVDSSGQAFVTGDTQSTNFPVTDEVFQEEIKGTVDAFITKLNSSGSAILASTYLGGDSDSFVVAYESGRAITLDRINAVYVAGVTSLRDFPTTAGAAQREHGGNGDVFVTVLSPDFKTLLTSTYLGGEANDTPTGIAVDGGGNLYVGGDTLSTRYPITVGSVQPFNNGGSQVNQPKEGFVTKMNVNGGMIYSTFLGGAGDDTVNGIVADAAGNAYVTGTTTSRPFPTTFDAFQNSPPTASAEQENAFVTQISPTGQTILYSSYLGGSRADQGNAIARDRLGNLFIAGYTQSGDFPLNSGALQKRTGFGTATAFIARVGDANLAPSLLRPIGTQAFTADEGTELTDALVVELLDQFNNPQQRVTINFTATNATLSAPAANTDSTGRASVRVRLGNRPGVASVTAQFGNLPPVLFTITVRRVGPPLPQVNSNGIIGAGLSVPPVRQISMNGIATVFGQNFAPAGTSRSVGPGDLVDGKLPNSFAGVCVTFNGVSARLFSVSSTQINLQIPELPSIGEARVVVITNCGQPGELRSDEQVVELLTASPEFFYYAHSNDGRNPVAAVNGVTGALVGPPDAVSGVTLVPAGPNDIVIVFGSGFGDTRPRIGSGELPATPASCVLPATVLLDGQELPAENVLYCGVTPGLAGVYQINFRVPVNARNGNLGLAVRFGSQTSPSGAYLRVAGGVDRDPRISISPERIEFGDVVVNQAREVPLTITNTGTAALTIAGFTPGLPIFSVIPNLGFRLDPGDQRIVNVRLAATGVGTLNASLVIRSDDPQNPNLSVPLVANVTGEQPVPNPAPVLSGLAPNTTLAGGAAFQLVVNGSNFVRSSVVEWNGAPRSTFFNHPGQLIAFITTQDIVAAGTAQVVVSTPAPGGGRSAPLTFTIEAAQSSGPGALLSQFDVRACPDVTTYTSVLNASGQPVGGLRTENLACTVNGLTVSCTAEPETEIPLSVVLIAGFNGLTREDDISLMKSAARSFIANLPEGTRISLIHLEDQARPLQQFTEDKDRILNLVDQLRAVPPGNALYDAITLAVTQVRNERPRRIAIVLFTAQDNSGGNGRDPIGTLGNARVEGLPFFTFAIGPGITDVNLTGFLRTLSRDTGGQLVTQGSALNYSAMMSTMNQILVGQYRVRHTGLAIDSQIRTLRLTFQTPFGTATGTRTYACAP